MWWSDALYRVILLDDSRVWTPPPAKQQLWTLLRLLMLESLQVVAAAQTQQQQQVAAQQMAAQQPQQQQQVDSEVRAAASAVVSRCRAELQRLVQAEWARVGRDVREDSGMPMSWLRGPSPVLPLRVFRRRWRGLVSCAHDPPALVMPGV